MRRCYRAFVCVAVLLTFTAGAVASPSQPTRVHRQQAADPVRMVLTPRDFPPPYRFMQRVGGTHALSELLGITVPSGVNSPAYRAARASRCAQSGASAELNGGYGKINSFVCIARGAADARLLGRAVLRNELHEYPRRGKCVRLSPRLGQSWGFFRLCKTPDPAMQFVSVWTRRSTVVRLHWAHPLAFDDPDEYTAADVLALAKRQQARVR